MGPVDSPMRGYGIDPAAGLNLIVDRNPRVDCHRIATPLG
jgi:hypothetical protein